MQATFSRALNLKEIKEEAATLATEVGGEPTEEFTAFVRSETQKWGSLIKEAGIKVQ